MRHFILIIIATLMMAGFSPLLTGSISSAHAQQTSAASEEDQKIQTKIRTVFGEIDEFGNIFVTVKGGVVTLKGRVLELPQVARAAELAGKIGGVITVKNLVDVETSVEKRLSPALERFQSRIQQFLAALPLFGVGVIIFFVVTGVGFLIAKRKNPWDALTPNQFIADLLRQFIRLLFLIIGLVLALDIMGATALLSTILGAAGILGLALGFAVRDTVENYIASILLSFRQPFRPRDCVQIGSHEGYVVALTSRATILLTYDGNHVRIPNATVFKGVITNFSLNPERRFSFEMSVQIPDPKQAVDLGVSTIRELSFVLKDPAADGWVNSVKDSNISIWFGGWINQQETSLAKARAEAIRKVRKAFANEGIELSDPHIGVRLTEATSIKKTSKLSATAVRKAAAIEKEMQVESDVSPDRELEKRIVEEELRNANNDLLTDDAPQELNS